LRAFARGLKCKLGPKCTSRFPVMSDFFSTLKRLPRLAWALLLFLPLILWMLASFKPMIHDDVGFVLFAMMNGRHFYLAHGRYSNVLNQIFPLLLTWGHASPRLIAYFFLLNLGLFYTAVACVCVAVSRSSFALCVLGLLVYAGLQEVLYWPISDFALGYGALAPVAAFLLDPDGTSRDRRVWQSACCLLCLGIALFFHPGVALGVAGLLVLSLLEVRRFDWRHGITLVILLGYGVYKLGTADGYETTHMSIGGWSDGRPSKPELIFTQLLPLYCPLVIFALYALYCSMAIKSAARWIILASYFGAISYFLFFYLPSNVYIYAGLYRSNLLIPSTFFLVVGGCYALFKVKSRVNPRVPILLTGVVSFLIGTIALFPHYQTQYEQTQKLVAEARKHKVPLAYLNTGPTFVDYHYGWGISVDTLLWSLMDGQGEPVSIVQESTLQDLYGPNYREEHEHFAAGFCVRPISFTTMNHDYFSFTPGPYAPLPKLDP